MASFEEDTRRAPSRPAWRPQRPSRAEIPAALDDLVIRTLVRRPEHRDTDTTPLVDEIPRTSHTRRSARHVAILSGIIDDDPAPPKLPHRAPQTRPGMPLQDTRNLHSTPPRGSPVTALDADDASSQTPQSTHMPRPVRATIVVLAVGVLSLLALLAYEASTPIPAQTLPERRPAPTPPAPRAVLPAP